MQSMLRKTLSPEQDQFVAEEVRILKHLKTTLKSMDANKEDLTLLSQSLAQIEDLFLLVIVGEFNSGKSSFLNALIGKKYLKEGGRCVQKRYNSYSNTYYFKDWSPEMGRTNKDRE
jgi:ribosome biogenesis GTPase A